MYQRRSENNDNNEKHFSPILMSVICLINLPFSIIPLYILHNVASTYDSECSSQFCNMRGNLIGFGNVVYPLQILLNLILFIGVLGRNLRFFKPYLYINIIPTPFFVIGVFLTYFSSDNRGLFPGQMNTIFLPMIASIVVIFITYVTVIYQYCALEKDQLNQRQNRVINQSRISYAEAHSAPSYSTIIPNEQSTIRENISQGEDPPPSYNSIVENNPPPSYNNINSYGWKENLVDIQNRTNCKK